MQSRPIIAVVAGLLALAASAHARIKLTTLPERETVRVDIQNGRYTLVEEERTVNLQAGRNQVDFSWANINIDKDCQIVVETRENSIPTWYTHQKSSNQRFGNREITNASTDFILGFINGQVFNR